MLGAVPQLIGLFGGTALHRGDKGPIKRTLKTEMASEMKTTTKVKMTPKLTTTRKRKTDSKILNLLN